jgi:hypothetical protein
MRIRKQVYDLTRLDLQQYPLWEFCSDEEGTPGQDEATVKPSEDSEVPAFSPGAYIVATDFSFADGSLAEGYIYSGAPEDFGCTTPRIFVEEGHVGFWFGYRAPQPEAIAATYRKLGRTPEAVFPIRYQTRVPVNGSLMNGRVRGFGMRGSLFGIVDIHLMPLGR